MRSLQTARTLLLAIGFAMSISVAQAQVGNCAGTLPPQCLQSFGAGSMATTADDGVDCGAQLADYRACIADTIERRGRGGPAVAPLTRAERGFLSALEAELADNVGRLAAFVDGLDLTGAYAVYENDWPALRLRFFNATQNPAYFAAPADWLAKTQGFYDDVETMLTREDVRYAYRRQVTSVLYDRRVVKERFQELVALGRDELLPAISAELAAN